MLVALDGRPEWLAIAAGGYLANSPGLQIHGVMLHDPRLMGYGGGAAVACMLAIARYLITRRASGAEPESATVPAALNAALPSGSAASLASAGPAAESVLEPTAIFPRPVKSPQESTADAGAR